MNEEGGKWGMEIRYGKVQETGGYAACAVGGIAKSEAQESSQKQLAAPLTKLALLFFHQEDRLATVGRGFLGTEQAR